MSKLIPRSYPNFKISVEIKPTQINKIQKSKERESNQTVSGKFETTEDVTGLDRSVRTSNAVDDEGVEEFV